MARGDVILVDIPAHSGRPGYEQTGSRPAVVVQADNTKGNLPTTIVVPLTSNLNAARFPYSIRIDPSQENGLNKPSIMLVFQMRVIDNRRLTKKIGRLEDQHIRQLEEEIRHLLDVA